MRSINKSPNLQLLINADDYGIVTRSEQFLTLLNFVHYFFCQNILSVELNALLYRDKPRRDQYDNPFYIELKPGFQISCATDSENPDRMTILSIKQNCAVNGFARIIARLLRRLYEIDKTDLLLTGI